ncbi:MAG: hypothetical protein K6F84_02495 [Lachnospiraceae bacterium]|nr:hypothetical protein [Lachnospiraceae bacterium]
MDKYVFFDPCQTIYDPKTGRIYPGVKKMLLFLRIMGVKASLMPFGEEECPSKIKRLFAGQTPYDTNPGDETEGERIIVSVNPDAFSYGRDRDMTCVCPLYGGAESSYPACDGGDKADPSATCINATGANAVGINKIGVNATGDNVISGNKINGDASGADKTYGNVTGDNTTGDNAISDDATRVNTTDNNPETSADYKVYSVRELMMLLLRGLDTKLYDRDEYDVVTDAKMVIQIILVFLLFYFGRSVTAWGFSRLCPNLGILAPLAGVILITPFCEWETFRGIERLKLVRLHRPGILEGVACAISTLALLSILALIGNDIKGGEGFVDISLKILPEAAACFAFFVLYLYNRLRVYLPLGFSAVITVLLYAAFEGFGAKSVGYMAVICVTLFITERFGLFSLPFFFMTLGVWVLYSFGILRNIFAGNFMVYCVIIVGLLFLTVIFWCIKFGRSK